MANAYIEIGTKDNNYARDIILHNLSGVEGIPYQFLPSVDRRVKFTSGEEAAIGRKYAKKIVSNIPLLFLTPCEPLFMPDYNNNSRSIVAGALIEGLEENVNNFFTDEEKAKSGKYYSVNFAYARYYDYLNCMLTSVASFLGIADKYIKFNGESKQIREINWAQECGSSFRTYFNSAENIVFYLDGMDSVSESFSNSSTESSLASAINGFSSQAKELEFLFGGQSNIINTAEDAVSSISTELANLLGSGKTLISSLGDSGVNTILNGGKIIFPEIWSDSNYDKSYSINIKLRSPDSDSTSIFLNILKPYCKILALTLPHTMGDNINGFRTPFLVKASCKGLFNVDMGMISGLSVTKGASCAWNDDGLPTQIDIQIDIADLYKSLAMTGLTDDSADAGIMKTFHPFKNAGQIRKVVNNTSYMDFLANMAGLNVCQMEIAKKAKLFITLTGSSLSKVDSTLGTRASQAISRALGRVYSSLND